MSEAIPPTVPSVDQVTATNSPPDIEEPADTSEVPAVETGVASPEETTEAEDDEMSEDAVESDVEKIRETKERLARAQDVQPQKTEGGAGPESIQTPAQGKGGDHGHHGKSFGGKVLGFFGSIIASLFYIGWNALKRWGEMAKGGGGGSHGGGGAHKEKAHGGGGGHH